MAVFSIFDIEFGFICEQYGDSFRIGGKVLQQPPSRSFLEMLPVFVSAETYGSMCIPILEIELMPLETFCQSVDFLC